MMAKRPKKQAQKTIARVQSMRRVKKDERKAVVADLYLEGWTLAEIGKEIGVTGGMVGKYLAEIRKEWSTTALDKWEDYLGQELSSIAKIEREAWKAWRRSVRDYEEHREKTASDGGEEVTKTKREQAGDSRFLDVAIKCSDKRERLLGLGDPETRERAGREREGRAPVVEIIITEREQIPKFLDYSEFEARQVAPIQVEGENLDEIDYADEPGVDGVTVDEASKTPLPPSGNGNGR